MTSPDEPKKRALHEFHRQPHRKRTLIHMSGTRATVSLLGGAILSVLALATGHELIHSIIAGWAVFATLYVVWTWAVVWRFDDIETSNHAREVDPSIKASDALVLIGTVASLVGVAFLLLAGDKGNHTLEAVLGVAAVSASWVTVHTVYMLRYARLYYSDEPGNHGINYEGGEPDYFDFAYVAYDIGMTYQIADTDLKTRQMRKLVLGHMLLSYILGVGVVSTAINLVVSLASS